ncbi:MAG: sodium ion-translocating decarboxylase subunit beta, partial [Clostridia bacterium]|nr:sodium ion-translocating decarboxylase subunit beta [Clostridia bacterium]
MDLLDSLLNFWESTGVYRLITSVDAQWWQTIIMLGIVCVLVYLAVGRGFEPLLLLPIAIGMLLTNLPGGGMFHSEYFMTSGSIDYLEVLQHGGLLDILYIGVKTGLYPCLIFIGIGAMTDFTPLISNPKSLL